MHAFVRQALSSLWFSFSYCQLLLFSFWNQLFLHSEMAEDPNKQADDHDKTTNNQTTKK